METLPIFVRDRAENQVLTLHHQLEASQRFGASIAQVETVALERGILPARYQRNRQIISRDDQLTLFRSQVAVIGCGGLGGYVIEELAGLGVGRIVVIDPDCFEEHNLNRQLLSCVANLGKPKVDAAVQRVAEINPAVTVLPLTCAFSAVNGVELLAGSNVVVDALDSIPVRLELADTCSRLGVPLVHGAIAGWFGHVATQFPGDDTLRSIYAANGASKGIEQQQGNPSFTPAVIASLESAEVCKILLGKGGTLRGRQLMVDLLDMEFHEIALPVKAPVTQ
jgi:molybdopterin/thiamine biosynthesis adenylyltransferase